MPADLDKRSAVERMQRFIEDNLTEPITLVGLAHSARYSPWYAARVFKELTGRSPFEYVRLRRLSEAAQRLATSSTKVIDVAFDFVFDSHEGFSRAFTRQFGMTPREFRKRRPSVKLFLPEILRHRCASPEQRSNTMAKKQHTNTVFVQVVDRPARKLILKRGAHASDYFEYCKEVGCDVWAQLGAIDAAIHEPMGLWLPESLRGPGTSTYAQGVEVAQDYAGAIPEGFDIIDLPACKLMVFQGPPFEDDHFQSAIRTLWDVMKDYSPEAYGFTWADDAGPRFQLEPLGYRGYIEGRPVVPVNTAVTS
jgi:AraC family transcriptional regulator